MKRLECLVFQVNYWNAGIIESMNNKTQLQIENNHCVFRRERSSADEVFGLN